ncbi:MAG: tyrosine-type recombinase/integrase [Bacteroidetes bacterium]|nr:tyrosine-type recombinase/integrase [Bacteroidota bacterium]
MYSAGLRVSEAVYLQISDLDFDRNMIHIRNAKGKKDRFVMLAGKVTDCLKEYRKYVIIHDWLFPGAALVFTQR